MMKNWQATSCALCAQNCGLHVKIDNNRIVKVRSDKANPRSQGYICRKGLNIANHQHHADRLTHPLKRTDAGFVKISWEQAIREIAEKLRSTVDTYGPKSFAYMGGGGQGCHFEAAFGISFMKGLGSRYHYNAIAQEFTGYFWACGRMFGRQNLFVLPDEHRADMLLGIGWNGMVSHQMPRAPLVLREFAKNPEKLLVVIDPRRSETAQIANRHIPIRPGTDALLARAMISLILQKGWEDREFLAAHTTGFDEIRVWFETFAIREALEVCQVAYTDVIDLCRELSRRKWCMHFDLGVYMNRHSTLATYLYMILSAICGRLCVPGGNVIPGALLRLGSHTDERDPHTWRTVTTDFPSLVGIFPPNVMPEEILSDHQERLRAVVVSSANPLRSYADTTAYEEAFKKLDLLVTIELSMTETAELAHYVLPARSAYESFDSTFFTWNYPEVYFQMRRPLIEPEGEPLEAGEIFYRLADALDLIPEIPDNVYWAAKKDRLSLAAALFAMVRRNPDVMEAMPFILARTLGQEVKSAHLAALWGLLLTAPSDVREKAARAGFAGSLTRKGALSLSTLRTAFSGMLRHKSIAPLAILTPQVAQSETLFEAIMAHPEGLWVGKSHPENNMRELKTDDGKIHLHIPELEEWIEQVTPEAEKKALAPDPDFPFVLNAGRHKPENANTLMRKPDWNSARRACTLAMHPDDATAMNLTDAEIVRITTEAASEEIELEVTEEVRRGQVLIAHGFGLKYQGETFGVNVNRLTKNTHRDRFAATPIHRYVPCRIEKVVF